MRLIIISIMTVLLIFGVAGAQVLDGVPHLISYQGLLADSGGNPVADGEYVIDFTIWSDSVSVSPTDREWISPSCTVLVVNGLFNWQLGSRENLPPWTMTNDVDLWLGIQVESDPEITPRTRLCSAPYAYKAWQADYAEYADSAGVALSGYPKVQVDFLETIVNTFSEVTVVFPEAFAEPPSVTASGIVIAADVAHLSIKGQPLKITVSSVTSTEADLFIEAWDGSAWETLSPPNDIVRVSWVAAGE